MNEQALIDEARRLDDADPIAGVRDEFIVADDDLVYFDGNSLGRLPKTTATLLADTVNLEWGVGLVRSWDQWIDMPTRVGDLIGEHLIGASAGQTIVADSTTVNLFKLAHAAIDAAPDRPVIVTDRGNFPTDRYVLDAVARSRGGNVRWVDDVASYEPMDGDGVVSFSLVDYRTGALTDLAAVTSAVTSSGAVTLWDLSHTAGAVEVDLDAAGVDFAVGCTYKFINGGPGSPAFAYVRADRQSDIEPVIPGWFGQDDQFAMGPDYQPAAGIRRLLTGTPDVAGLVAVEAGVNVLARAGVAALQAKSRALIGFLQRCIEPWAGDHGFTVVSPMDESRRGSQLSLRHGDAWQVCQAFRDRGVVPDYRTPDIIRLGIAPAYTRFIDVLAGAEALRTVMTSGAHRDHPAERGRVT